jgi:hypothetical protein
MSMSSALQVHATWRRGRACRFENVWWVDNNAAPGGDGSEADPFNTFPPALTAVADAGGEGTIFAIGGGLNYASSISINPGQTIAIIGDGAVTVSLMGQAVLVDSNAVGMLSGIKISGATTGINCQGGEVWLDRLTILDSNGIGGGGIVVSSGEVTVRNSFIGGNSSSATAPAVRIGQGVISLIYSTLATGEDAPAIECQVNGANMTVRNSLIVSRNESVAEIQSCAGATITSSALEMTIAGNLDLPEMTDTSWFAGFNTGNFRLSGSQPAEIATAATWLTGDPSIDIEGDPRPSADGTADYAGADVP